MSQLVDMSKLDGDTQLKTEPSSFKSWSSDQTPKLAPRVVNGKFMLVPGEEEDPDPGPGQERGGENI